MLRKMYLVSEDQINKTKTDQNPPKTKKVLTRKKIQQHDYDKWLQMRDKIREDEIRHKNQIKAIADFLQKVLPQQQHSKKVSFKPEQQHSDVGENPRKRRLAFAPSPEDVYEPLPSTSVFYETAKKSKIESDDVSDATEVSPEHVRKFGRANFGALASPYLTPYVYNKRFLDKQYVSEKMRTVRL
jgi:hypothetical protein